MKRKSVINWMKQHLIEAREDGLVEMVNLHGLGEVNTTRLAEEAAWDLLPHEEEFGDPDHEFYDYALEVGAWYESQYSAPSVQVEANRFLASIKGV